MSGPRENDGAAFATLRAVAVVDAAVRSNDVAADRWSARN
jgi:hypothetical protein